MSIAKWTLIFCFGRKPAFPERRLKLGVAPTPISTAALRYDRLTSTRDVASAQIAAVPRQRGERVKSPKRKFPISWYTSALAPRAKALCNLPADFPAPGAARRRSRRCFSRALGERSRRRTLYEKEHGSHPHPPCVRQGLASSGSATWCGSSCRGRACAGASRLA
jgi:hypothetical protein